MSLFRPDIAQISLAHTCAGEICVSMASCLSIRHLRPKTSGGPAEQELIEVNDERIAHRLRCTGSRMLPGP